MLCCVEGAEEKMSVTPEPPQALFTPGVPGASHHKLKNGTGGPLAVKIKCSDNALYKVRPVFGVVPAGGEAALELARAAGPAKQDKLVIQSLACADAGLGNAAVAELFKAPGAAPASATLALVAADAPAAAPQAAPAEQITQDQLQQFNAEQPPPA